MLKLVFYVVVAVLVLSFFGISLQHLVEAPTTQANFGYVGDLLSEGWNDLVELMSGFWHTFF